VLLAAADDADPDHRDCVDLVAAEPGPLVTTPLVIAEAQFLRSIADGDVEVETLTATTRPRTRSPRKHAFAFRAGF
jgi:hypothetical protein